MKLALYISALALSLLACNNGDSVSSNDSSVEEIEGMILVHGGTTTLGSNDAKYKASERPAMKVKLDYDFYLATHEMTCGEYRTLAKKQKLKDFGKCKKDRLPLANVTFYDAILAANAKSKAEKRDTAYTYSKATFDSEGHCTNLEGFIFHPEVDAYRLPTEAEWVLAATNDWDPKNKSWNADNSDFSAHVVCTAKKDDLGFCDLAGNVKEWVNDWAGSFRDTVITNYVGAPNGNDLGERILKGGYFSNRASEMNVIARGDEYTVEGSTHADRIGFRLAFGQIPSPVWLDVDGKVNESPVTAIANASSLKSFTGSHNMILAFRNDISGNLAFIDYNEGNSVTEIRDTLKVYHPDISPDGKRVAFCTKPEGLSGTSKLYVRDLNSKGTNLVRLDVKSAAIPRWRVLENGDTAIVYVTDAGINNDTATFKKASTWEVKFSKGKFGTPQKLFDGAYHGGISKDNRLAISGARWLRARIANSGSTITQKARDTVWYNKEQACNASLVQDGSKRTAFLDFSGKTGEKFVGENYTSHEHIFIADSNGKLIQSIKSPSGYTFDHSEWATDGKQSNIVATLTNINGANEKIILVSPKDSSILELAEGEELWHPCLWIQRTDTTNSTSNESGIEYNLDPDSAGIYFTAGGSNDAEKYRYKMELLWQYRDSVTTVFLGSSRIFHALDPTEISRPQFAINMANDHNTLNGSFFLFETYILPLIKNLKYVVIGIDADRLKFLDSFFDSEAWTYPGYVYDRNHNYWKEGIPKDLYSMTNSALVNSQKLKKDLLPNRGYRGQACNGWSDSLPTVKGDSGWYSIDPSPFNQSLEKLKKMAKLAAEKNIYVIALETPQNPAYKNTGAYGIDGILRSEAPALLKKIQNISKDYPNFIFMDENKMGDHDYTSEMAYDDSHLGYLGAEKLSLRVDSLIKTLDVDLSNKKKN